MAGKKKTTVTVELEIEVLEKLVQAADALSELASASISGSDDPKVRALAKKSKKSRR
jgi:hypothetical protein